MSRLRAEAVTVRYGELVALRGVELDLGPGRLVAVTGPSGAGKSTLLWALAGALAPAEGRVSSTGRSSPGASTRQGGAS